MQGKEEVRSQDVGQALACRRASARLLLLAILASPALAQTTDLAPVISKPESRTVDLPAEISPYLSVSLHAKVRGYVDKVPVDRGSVVKEGELLASLTAPETE